MKRRQKILFLCTGNSCRSQMAEGWARHLHSERIEAFSAGLEAHGLNPLAVKAMKMEGVDISRHHSKTVEQLADKDFDQVITVCGHADENCPLFGGGTEIIHHGFDDPPQLAEKFADEKDKLACYREVCRQLRKFIKDL
ncbi:MAG: arsenate reductase ArsC [Thermodesulfobacteriota bacterium]